MRNLKEAIKIIEIQEVKLITETIEIILEEEIIAIVENKY